MTLIIKNPIITQTKVKITSKHHSDNFFYIELFQALHAGTEEHTQQDNSELLWFGYKKICYYREG